MVNSRHSEREREIRVHKEAFKLCKYSGSAYTSYRPCPRDRNCKRCEYEQSLIDWKRGKEW